MPYRESRRMPVAGASVGGSGHPDKILFDALNSAVLSRFKYAEKDGIEKSIIPLTTRIDTSGIIDCYGEKTRLLVTGNTNLCPEQISGFNSICSGNLYEVLKAIGYSPKDVNLSLNIRPTSKALIDKTQKPNSEIKYGDGRLVTGSATDETERGLPLVVSLLQDISSEINAKHKNGIVSSFHNNYKMELLADSVNPKRPLYVSYQIEALPDKQHDVVEKINEIILGNISLEAPDTDVEIKSVPFYNNGRKACDVDKGDRSKPGITGGFGYGYNAPGGGIGGIYPHPDITATTGLRSLAKNALNKFGLYDVYITAFTPIGETKIRPFQIVAEGESTEAEDKAKEYILSALKETTVEDIILGLKLGDVKTHELLLERDPFDRELPWEKETELW